MHTGEVVDRLAAQRLFAGVPRAELEWFAARGEVRACTVGTILLELGAAIEEMFVVLDGRTGVYMDKGGLWRRTNEAGPGGLHGAIPYSRGRKSSRRLAVEDDATIFVLGRAHFTELIRDCPELTARFVHEMIDRARAGQSDQLHDEQLRSLGRLASGLAHELNNPASAASRGALLVGTLVDEAERAARALAEAHLNDAQLEALDAVRAAMVAPASSWSAIELSEREDQFADWLDRHEVETAGAEALAASALRPTDLDHLAESLALATLGDAVRWVGGVGAARAVSAEVASATGRIHELVDAVKRFTFMDRESIPGEVDVAQGLADTLAVLENRSKTLSVAVRLDIAPSLPRIFGFGSEINQVWEKLLDNAIDAAGPNGHVTVTANAYEQTVVVAVTDDGPGIAEANRMRVFEPFFTTKPIGQSAGLGLHLARRVVLFHHGDVDFTSEPGRTTFRVRLPVRSSAFSPSAV